MSGSIDSGAEIVKSGVPSFLQREPCKVTIAESGNKPDPIKDGGVQYDENGQIRFHPAAALFPLMAGSDYGDLIADIARLGLRDPIVLHPDGTVLDGRNRYRACRQAKIQPTYTTWTGKPGTEIEFVISVNLRRRHLTAEQKRDVIAKLLEENPEPSNVTIGRMAKADDKTVASQRRKMESTSEIPRLDRRIGADGKVRSAPPIVAVVDVGTARARAQDAADSDDLHEGCAELHQVPDAGEDLVTRRKRWRADLDAAWERADTAVRQGFVREKRLIGALDWPND